MYKLASEYEEAGNAFCILGYVSKAMKENGMTNDEISAYKADAMSSNYEHLRQVSQDMIDKLNGLDEDNYNPFDADENEELYESLMKNVKNAVKKALNESIVVVDMKIDVDDSDYYDDEDEALWDVPVRVEFNCDPGFKGSKTTPPEEPSMDLEEISFDKRGYSEKECSIIQKFIEDNLEKIEQDAFDKYCEECEAREAMMGDDRYKEWKESQI